MKSKAQDKEWLIDKHAHTQGAMLLTKYVETLKKKKKKKNLKKYWICKSWTAVLWGIDLCTYWTSKTKIRLMEHIWMEKKQNIAKYWTSKKHKKKQELDCGVISQDTLEWKQVCVKYWTSKAKSRRLTEHVGMEIDTER